jgi:hypothetical protein
MALISDVTDADWHSGKTSRLEQTDMLIGAGRGLEHVELNASSAFQNEVAVIHGQVAGYAIVIEFEGDRVDREAVALGESSSK